MIEGTHDYWYEIMVRRKEETHMTDVEDARKGLADYHGDTHAALAQKWCRQQKESGHCTGLPAEQGASENMMILLRIAI